MSAFINGFQDELEKVAGAKDKAAIEGGRKAKSFLSSLYGITIPAAITGALGAGAGALIANDKPEGASIGALAGAGMGAAPGTLMALAKAFPGIAKKLAPLAENVGAASPHILAGGGIGAATGAIMGDEENRARNAVLGGLLGSAALGVPGMIAHEKAKAARSWWDRLDDVA